MRIHRESYTNFVFRIYKSLSYWNELLWYGQASIGFLIFDEKCIILYAFHLENIAVRVNMRINHYYKIIFFKKSIYIYRTYTYDRDYLEYIILYKIGRTYIFINFSSFYAICVFGILVTHTYIHNVIQCDVCTCFSVSEFCNKVFI